MKLIDSFRKDGMLASSLYRGQRIIGYRESMGGDNRWHAQVVLAGESRVYLDERR